MRPTRSTLTAAAWSARACSLSGVVNQNEIFSNSIFGNAGLGINLGDGPTPNHVPARPGRTTIKTTPT